MSVMWTMWLLRMKIFIHDFHHVSLKLNLNTGYSVSKDTYIFLVSFCVAFVWMLHSYFAKSRQYWATSISQSIDVGSRGKGKKQWAQWDAKTCCLTLPCRQSLKTNPSKSYIKKSDIFPLQRGKLGPLQLSTETLNKLCLHGIVRSHLYLSEFTFVATMAPIPWTHVAIL